MKNIFVLILCMIFSLKSIHAQNVSSNVAKGNKALASMNEKLALQYYKKAIADNKKDDAAYAGASLMYSRIGNRQTSKEKQANYFKAAKVHALIAVKLKPKKSFNNYAVAVAMGRMALISGSKKKVAASRDIKNFSDKAIKLNPKNADAWNVLGKWNAAISNLNFAEKAAAKMLFGGLPNGDINKALKCFEKAKALNSKMVRNYLDLAKAYKQVGNKAKAKETIQTGLKLKNREKDDPKHKKEMQKLLTKL